MLFSTGTFDHVVPNEPRHELPLRLCLMPDRGRTIAQLLLIVPLLLMMLAPAGFATHLLARDDLANLARQDAFTFVALAAQPIVWLALLVWSVVAVAPRLGRRRVVTLTGESVTALERGLTGTEAWKLPTASYRGIAHHVRATAGVVSHEVILVHDDPRRSVLLHTAPMVAQSSLDHFCGLLRLPLVPSREVYRLPRMGVSLLPEVSTANRDGLRFGVEGGA